VNVAAAVLELLQLAEVVPVTGFAKLVHLEMLGHGVR
jgi:hypothetical protein